MGGDLAGKRGGGRSSRKKKRSSSSSSASYSSSGSDSESPERRRSSRRHREEKKHRSARRRSRREAESSQKLSSSSRKRKSTRRDREEEEERKRRRRKHGRRSRREESGSKKRVSRSESSSSDGGDSETDSPEPEATVRHILKKFPDAVGDLKQLLQMIDNGQAVDVRGISNRTLVKLLKKLFRSLNLKENEDGIFLLPPSRLPTLDVVGSLLSSTVKPREFSHSGTPNEVRSSSLEQEFIKDKDEADIGQLTEPHGKHDSPIPFRRRLIGPEMPSSELLAAAAELTEAETALRDADLEVSDDLFIGPPPPAVVAEAESANEAERFEEVARIIGAEADKPYDVLGVNWKMSIDSIKKRYWKFSLMVHPDKCSHPQAHQAFVILNKAFKELQDPDKRKAMDENIRLKEEQEEFKAELQALREAAQWRRLQGISMEGDDELLAETTQPPQPPKREEWMTTLPPERKPGMTMQSTSFSRSNKEGRGDTSIWTDSPLDKAEKAKRNYLEAYDKATALAAADDEKKRTGSDADLVDRYNRSKRSISLVQKHQEERSRPKRKSKKPEKEEWVGEHPWKPWDREKDLTAGRQKVNLDSDGMSQGLASRFSSGTVQRSFL